MSEFRPSPEAEAELARATRICGRRHRLPYYVIRTLNLRLTPLPYGRGSTRLARITRAASPIGNNSQELVLEFPLADLVA